MQKEIIYMKGNRFLKINPEELEFLKGCLKRGQSRRPDIYLPSFEFPDQYKDGKLLIPTQQEAKILWKAIRNHNDCDRGEVSGSAQRRIRLELERLKD